MRLERGEERSFTVRVPMRAFTTVDGQGVRCIRGKGFSVYVGFSQPDKRSVELMGAEPVCVFVEMK